MLIQYIWIKINGAYNYQEHTCSLTCPYSFSEDFECINNFKIGCVSCLYHRESGNCLIYCPDNSCICSCKAGYKKVSENPPACIKNQWGV